MPGTSKLRRVTVNTQQIEVNKMSFEVQTQAVVRSTIKIGDKLRILKKSSYSDPVVCDGIVIGFEPFKTLPSIVIAYIEDKYTDADLKFLVWNDSTKDVEITAAIPGPFDKNLQHYEKKIEAKIAKLEQEQIDLRTKLDFMRSKFGLISAAVINEEPAVNEDAHV